MTNKHRKKNRDIDINQTLVQLRNAFFAGLAMLIPAYMTFWIISLVVNLLDSFVPFVGNKSNIPGLGILSSVIVITAIGVFGQHLFGKRTLQMFEDLMNRLPLVKNIYQSSKQIVSALSSSSMTNSFKRVVMVEYPRKGVWAMGFVTKDQNQSISLNGKPMDDWTSVYLPTTPNPTSGYMLLVNKEEVVEMNMSVEDGVKMIMSAGMITPDMSEKEIAAIKEARKD